MLVELLCLPSDDVAESIPNVSAELGVGRSSSFRCPFGRCLDGHAVSIGELLAGDPPAVGSLLHGDFFPSLPLRGRPIGTSFAQIRAYATVNRVCSYRCRARADVSCCGLPPLRRAQPCTRHQHAETADGRRRYPARVSAPVGRSVGLMYGEREDLRDCQATVLADADADAKAAGLIGRS